MQEVVVECVQPRLLEGQDAAQYGHHESEEHARLLDHDVVLHGGVQEDGVKNAVLAPLLGRTFERVLVVLFWDE